jgi:hypothetical protein
MEGMNSLLLAPKEVFDVTQSSANPTSSRRNGSRGSGGFPPCNVFMQVRDTLGTIYTDEANDLFPTHGQPAFAP